MKAFFVTELYLSKVKAKGVKAQKLSKQRGDFKSQSKKRM